MKTSEAGIVLIQRFEGFSASPYLCPAGYWTIGYGHVLKPEECRMYVDTPLATKLLIQDVAVAERAVSKFILVPLNQNQFDALVSFTFNLGSGVLQRSTLRRKINEGDRVEIPRQWMRYVWAGGRKLPGLVQRRTAELTLFKQ